MNIRSQRQENKKICTHHASPGFTLIEVLVSVTIFAIIMSILYSSFSASAANAKAVEEMADDLSSVMGAVDAVSREVRGVRYSSDAQIDGFSGKKDFMTFTTNAPFVRDGEPTIQRISYIFEEDRLMRRAFRPDSEKDIKSEYMLLDGIKDASFTFFDGKGWIEDWPSGNKMPAGVRVVFSHKDRKVESVLPLWSRM